MFEHNLLPFKKLKVIEGRQRCYILPSGEEVLSVTSVISGSLDRTKLNAWKKRNPNAEQITMQAQDKGNDLHALCERYLRNDPDWRQDADVIRLEAFSHLKTILDKNITIIYGIEMPLWSSKLHTAGRFDLFAEWRGENAIVDFKTAKKEFSPDSEKALGYILQSTAYAMMAEERYGMSVPLCKIPVIVEREIKPQIIAFENHVFRSEVQRIFQASYEKRTMR